MKKLLSVLSVLLVAVMMLTACGTKPAADTSSTAPASTAESKAASTAAEGTSEYAGMGTGKTLVYWAEWNETETQAEVYKRAIDRFQKDTGYTVEVQWDGRDVNKLYPAAIDAGTAIDIYDASSSTPTLDYCLDIDALADKYGIKAAMLPVCADYASSFSEDGHWYSVPNQPFVGAVFYNKDIFKEAGIDALPTTWDEFLADCKKIKDAGYDPMTIDDAYVSLLYTQELGDAMGAEKVKELGTATGDAWKAPEVLTVMTKWEEFTKAGYFSSTVGGNKFPSAQNGELAVGTAAMYFNGSWLPNEVHDITGDTFNWGTFVIPSMTGTDYNIPMIGCQNFCVSPKSADPDGAVLLIKYLTDATTCQDLADTAQCIPVVDGVTWPKSLADAKTIFETAKTSYRWGVWSEKANQDVTTLADTYFHQLIGGKLTAQAFVDHMVSGK